MGAIAVRVGRCAPWAIRGLLLGKRCSSAQDQASRGAGWCQRSREGRLLCGLVCGSQAEVPWT